MTRGIGRIEVSWHNRRGDLDGHTRLNHHTVVVEIDLVDQDALRQRQRSADRPVPDPRATHGTPAS